MVTYKRSKHITDSIVGLAVKSTVIRGEGCLTNFIRVPLQFTVASSYPIGISKFLGARVAITKGEYEFFPAVHLDKYTWQAEGEIKAEGTRFLCADEVPECTQALVTLVSRTG